MKLIKTIMVMACLLLTASHTDAETKQKLTVNAATVFLSGASLTSTAKMALAKGEQDVLFTNVASNVNTASIIVNATNGAVVEATIFQNNPTMPDVLSHRSKEIRDSIAIILDAQAIMAAKIDVIDEQVVVLQNNRKVSSDNNGLSVAELIKMLDLIAARMEGLINEKNLQENLMKKADDRIAVLKQQYDDEQRKGILPGGQLLVRFFAEEPINSTITVTYVVPGAGWAPAYDIMADAVNKPIKLYYKANVYQNSGIKWDNVQLSLSTGNPSESVQPPVIIPWYLSIFIPQQNYTQHQQADYVVSAYRKPLIDMDKPSSRILTKDEIATIPTTQASDYNRSRSAGTQYIIDGVQVQAQQGSSSITNYTAVNNAGVNTSFDIDLPYTIPCDGKQHMVAIKKYEVPATYRYYAVPKLDKDAFLQAQVTNWEDLNLLPGQTNVFYEGAYVGQGRIGASNPSDTMTISLGRDKKIVITRERDKTLRSVKTIGSNVRETFAYTITIRNSRKEPISLVVQDQIPVSNDKDIVVEDINTDDSDFDEATGLMNWTLSPGAGENKKLTLGFTIKYPKGKPIVGLK